MVEYMVSQSAEDDDQEYEINVFQKLHTSGSRVMTLGSKMQSTDTIEQKIILSWTCINKKQAPNQEQITWCWSIEELNWEVLNIIYGPLQRYIIPPNPLKYWVLKPDYRIKVFHIWPKWGTLIWSEVFKKKKKSCCDDLNFRVTT